MSDWKKYLICPGEIKSKLDGDYHWVTGTQLIKLYGLRRCECVIEKKQLKGLYRKDLIQLGPRYDGNYIQPQTKKERN